MCECDWRGSHLGPLRLRRWEAQTNYDPFEEQRRAMQPSAYQLIDIFVEAEAMANHTLKWMDDHLDRFHNAWDTSRIR